LQEKKKNRKVPRRGSWIDLQNPNVWKCGEREIRMQERKWERKQTNKQSEIEREREREINGV